MVLQLFFSLNVPGEPWKHIASPGKKPVVKTEYYLRWMVRKDNNALILVYLEKRFLPLNWLYPLDVHVARVARKNLLYQKQTDWQTAVELTKNETTRSGDPIKYDFALFCAWRTGKI